MSTLLAVDAHPEEPSAVPDPAPAASGGSLRRTGWWAGALVLLLAAGGVARALDNARQQRAAARASDAGALRHVLTVQPARAGGAARALTLPGTLRGAQEAALYARTGGYIQRWTKDIGDPVRRGDLLAELDAPEADEELRQARATRDQVRARAALAQSSLARWEALGSQGAVSRQELDERRAAHTQGTADVAAADANVQRLEALRGLRRVVAPFDGVVVRRNAEVGTLINGSATAGRELYAIAQVDTLRIDLAVPQAYAARVDVGQAVSVRWPEKPGLAVEGRISRTAPGIDPLTRSRQVVIELPNPGRQLLPGSYVDVQLFGAPTAKGGATPAAAAAGPLTVPPGALQFRHDGPRVALVKDGRVVLRTVKLGRELGKEVEVLSGLSADDTLVIHPPDSIGDGEPVEAQAAGK
jgi:RND family efflux transporter MFP subunit